MSKKYYAVLNGREGTQIYNTWEECDSHTAGYSGTIFKSFHDIESATKYIEINGGILNSVSDCSVKNQVTDGKKKIIIIKKVNPLKDANISYPTYTTFIVYTDGSCIHQGTTSARAGAGVYFPDLDIKHSSKVPGKQTNNRGELYAVILALRFVTEICGDFSKLAKIQIHLDSTYVMNNLKSNNKVNLDLWVQLLELVKKIRVEWIKELAHSGNYGNEIADKLAKHYSMQYFSAN